MSAVIQNDERYYAEQTKLTQVYFYLTPWLGKSIPDYAFNNMQSVLDQLRNEGYKIVLIFAYRYDETCAYETYGDIKRHLSQLKPFLQKNESMIFAVQAGFLGLWGEWHDSGLDQSVYHRKVVIRDILDAIPPSRKMQVRETNYKTDASGFIRRTPNASIDYYPLNKEEYNRIGFQNAYFVLEQGPYARFDYRWPDPDYFMVQNEGLTTVVDGEMPYNGNGRYDFNMLARGQQGGWHAIKRMQTHYYSSFSVVHNYSLNIAAWKKQMVYPAFFKQEQIEFSGDYFTRSDGEVVGRSAYEYIRDHLGYRFQLKDAGIPGNIQKGETANFVFHLKNYGFAPLINKRPVYLVFIDENEKTFEYKIEADPREWLPVLADANATYEFKHSIPTNDLEPGIYKVGLWLPDEDASLRYNHEYAIRLANGDMEYWTGSTGRYLVNVVGSIRIN